VNEDNIKESITNTIEDDTDENSIVIHMPEDNTLEEEQPLEQLDPFSNQRNEKGHRQRPGKNLKNRINSLTAQIKERDAQNQHLVSLVQEQERRLSEIQSKAEQNAHYTNIYYEQSLDNEKQHVLAELKIAKENGEIDKEVALSERLAEISAEKKTQLLSKTLQRQQSNQNDNNNYYQPQTYNRAPPPVEDINEDLEDFLDLNPFLDPNSHEFDHDISNEIGQFASDLNKVLKVNRKSNLIGTREYYGILNEEINKRYGIENISINNNYNESYEDNYSNNNYEVAPVNRKGSSMANRYTQNPQNFNPQSNNQRIYLSPQETEIAKNMVNVLGHYNGKTYTEKEAIAEYCKQKNRGNVKEV